MNEKTEMKIARIVLLFISHLEVVLAGPCDPGKVVYATYPGTAELQRATVVSQVVDGHILVKWASNPKLCENTSNRVPCVVDATITYNGKVCLYVDLQNLSQGELCASPTGTPTTPSSPGVSTGNPNGNPTQPSVFTPLEILGLLSVCFIGIPLAGSLLVCLGGILFPVRDSYIPREELDTYMARHEFYNSSDIQESNRNRILSFANA